VTLAPVLLLLTGVVVEPAAAYDVRLDAALSAMTVEFCLEDGTGAARLVTRQREAERFRSPARVTRGWVDIVEVGRGIGLRDAEPGSCIAYDVALDRLEREGGERALRREGESILTSSDLWLWRPADGLKDRPVRLRLDLPAGMEASVPWPPFDRAGADHVYRLPPTPLGWHDLTAFGRLSFSEIEVPGARLRLAIADASPRADAGAMAAWIREAASAVSTLYGRFPLPAPQVIVVPVGHRGEAVPWAQVQRGGGAAAHFYVDQFRPLEEFRDDWTATHELSHMLLPFVTRDDAWLSEGFASYYQNVLRARAGMIAPALAWEKLYAGFRRGRRDADGETLAEASRDMNRDGAYMRVYWSGAAMALLADVGLRAQSRGEQSLDTVLEGLADCCLPSYRTWTARELLARLDELAGQGLFTELYRRHVDSPEFPDLAGVSAALGIAESSDGLRFTTDRAAAAVRQAIMAPPKHRLVERDRRDGRDSPTQQETGRPGDDGRARGPTP
jgi:hypothetical protein